MLGNSSEVEFYKTVSKFRKRKQSRCLELTSTKHEIRHFHILVVQREKHYTHAKLLLCKSKPMVLFYIPVAIAIFIA